MEKIKIDRLSYSVPSRQILNNVSLHVNKNQFVGLIGPNGSGKTTLLKHIYRVLPPEKNSVFINGISIESISFRETARQLTVMKQENHSDFDYTILEMVLMGRSPYKKLFEGDNQNDISVALDSLDAVGMGEYADREFGTLSGGEKQRVLIARSLAQQADILILDEPTNHLDVHYQWGLMKLIGGLDKTVISVFHELNLACTFCDYIYVLKDGKIFAHGAPNDICTPALFKDVFKIKAEIIYRNKRPYILYDEAL